MLEVIQACHFSVSWDGEGSAMYWLNILDEVHHHGGWTSMEEILNVRLCEEDLELVISGQEYLLVDIQENYEAILLDSFKDWEEAELALLSRKQQPLDWRPNEMVPEDYYAL